MARDAVEGSPVWVSPAKLSQNQRQHRKREVYREVLHRLKDSGCPDALSPSFEEELWAHFNRLPARYALDVNVERAEDVLAHKRLLLQAHNPANWLAFDVRTVQIPRDSSFGSNSPAQKTYIHPPPTFGSSTNLENLANGTDVDYIKDEDSVTNSMSPLSRPMHEMTFSTVDKPKLLSQLTAVFAEIGLNILEAHAFSTNDGYSLDVFVVEGWPYEEIDQLKEALQNEIQKAMKNAYPSPGHGSLVLDDFQLKQKALSKQKEIPTVGADIWEIDANILEFQCKFASGACGDLYRGTYCSQDVAIKVFKSEHVSFDMQSDFAQEVYIMRKIRHKNVVQFIGACTKPPNLFIVTEFMSGGSVFDYLCKQEGVIKLPSVLRIAIDVSKGMNYLHQNNIIHRDLKTANLLMDTNDVVKVADFGVARVKTQSGIMTAETGTYRWMAPEVIEHRPYDHKADVYSFGIMMWELLTGKLPYECLTPLQAAVGVLKNGLRPVIPGNTHPKLAALIEKCWQKDAALRPDFPEILDTLHHIANEGQE